MANAVILKDGKVVRSTNFTNITYFLNGFVSEFTFKNKTYRYCSVLDFRSNDITDSKKDIFDLSLVGYFDKSKYLSYVKADGKVDISQINNFKLSNNDFEFAENQDDIIVELLKIDEANLSRYPFVNLYTWKYDKTKDIVGFSELEPYIKFPENLTPTEKPKYVCDEALKFYLDKIKLVKSNNFKDDKIVSANIIARIALYIHHINTNVFPMFNDPVSKNYIVNQNIEWGYIDIFQEPSISIFNSYLSSIREFYKQAFINQHMISRAVGFEKIYWLARGFSVGGLSVFPSDDKIKLIKYILNNKTSDYLKVPIDEKLIVDLTLSFTGNNIYDINSFLYSMKKTIDIDKSNVKTLYQTIYEKMSTPWLITESTIELSNWLFNATWVPVNTRQAFVKAIYRLWIVSRYNPYDISNNQLRNNCIGIRKIENGVTKYRVETIDSNNNYNIDWSTSKTGKFYYYTTYSGYTKTENVDLYSNDIYQLTHTDASPILLPYSSNKFGGIYFDNMSFNFKGVKIQCFEEYSIKTQYGTTDHTIFYGEYDIFQPITPYNYNIDSIMQLPSTDGESFTLGGVNVNSLIPIFIFHHIDEQGDKSDAQVVLGYVIDAISTLSGVGNIAKLAHLRNLSLINKIQVVVGTVEFATGSLGIMLNFVDNCSNDTGFCKNLKTFLFWVELSTLSTDIIVTKMVKSSAKRIVDDGFPDEFNDLPSKQKIEEIAGGVDLTVDIQKLIDNLTDSIYPNLIDRISESGGGFAKQFFNSNYPKNQVREIVDSCVSLGIYSEKTIHDFILIATRSSKRSLPSDLLIQINYYVKVIVTKGFPTGFSSLDDYKLFCNNIKNYIESFQQNKIKYIEIRVQGSVLKKRHQLDPPDPLNTPFLKKRKNKGEGDFELDENGMKKMDTPGDIDIDILMSKTNARIYAENAKRYWQNRINELPKPLNTEQQELFEFFKTNITQIDLGISKGIIKGNFLPSNTLSVDFITGLRTSAKSNGNDLFKPLNSVGESEVNASIIIKDSRYDILPIMPFKF